jgi:hypothetical protein
LEDFINRRQRKERNGGCARVHSNCSASSSQVKWP